MLKILETSAGLRKHLDEQRLSGKKIGFVPTMGALHQGHGALVTRARSECDLVVCSIFVNPTQFNDKKDLEHYPRTPDADRALLESAGCDIIFSPSVDEMYPPGEKETVPAMHWGVLDRVMEAHYRPGHFGGVVRIVSKLFHAVGPCRTYFGQKDFQQLAVIRQMVRDLALPVEVIGCPTVREADGLAMSSRNMRLTAEERAIAPLLSRALFLARELWPDHDEAVIRRRVLDMLAAEPRFRLEYFEIADADTLLPLPAGHKKNAVACIAAYLGVVRLIDNVLLA
ncbi:MAG: pantoate--beta-alanine ligase [Bacteroidetes bacterium]|nr:MAG: pantoate--beta-alanine ligase [Bacteroidota bacterium]